MDREFIQKLVDYSFEMISMATTEPGIMSLTRDEKMNWARRQLNHLLHKKGLHITDPVGMSWGVVREQINQESLEPTGLRLVSADRPE